MTDISTSALQEMINRIRAESGVTGASIATAHRGQLRVAAAGTANATFSEPMLPETLLQIGSTTKVYTAVLVLQLAEQGLLDIDAPVSAVLPGVRLSSDAAASLITPRQLMSMTSGLTNGPYRDTGRGNDSVQRYVELLADLPLLFEPGTSYSYSNASTVVSGLIVERLTGLPWDDALAEHLLRPAGLRESETDASRMLYRRVSVGHTPGLDGEVVEQDWTFSLGMGPTGSTLATTAADLARFGQLFLTGGVAEDGTRVLSGASVHAMQTPQVAVPSRWFADDWCAGPYRKVWGGVEVFGHGGTTQQGSSTLTWIPSLDLSVAVIVNNPSLGYPFAHSVLDEVVGDWFGVDKPKRPVADPELKVDLTPYLGEYRNHDNVYVFSERDGVLTLVASSTSELTGTEIIETELQPLGDHRFLAVDDRITSFHNWDLAFSRIESGHASLFHNGAFAATRQSCMAK